ncbi:MAG: thioredoxin family protein [Melioribacteraceae bacterium]|nr:thioredoxin family protein [Melioribacteraceae bacterium]
MFDKRLQEVLAGSYSYDEFRQFVENYVNTANPADLHNGEKVYYEYSRLNVHRTNRIHKTYTVSENLAKIIFSITSKQTWLIITEGWCGDSAQNLPYLSKMTELSPYIDLRIIERDKYPDIIDRYLTNGNRSIPKLIAFDEDGNELFQWGPRPDDAQQLIKLWKSEGLEKNEFNEKLHLWYAQNRGTSLESEFINLLTALVNSELIS